MTTFFTLSALAIIAYRYRKGVFTKVEWGIIGICGFHFIMQVLMLWSERITGSVIVTRYIHPVNSLLWVYIVWALKEFNFRWVVYVCLAAFVVYDIAMLVKPWVPGSRRYDNIVAGNWAVEKIRKDFTMSTTPQRYKFSIKEYARPNRPVVDGINRRVAYILGGRSPTTHFGKRDMPDYVFSCNNKPAHDHWGKKRYKLLAELKLRKRTYHLYKRIIE